MTDDYQPQKAAYKVDDVVRNGSTGQRWRIIQTIADEPKRKLGVRYLVINANGRGGVRTLAEHEIEVSP